MKLATIEIVTNSSGVFSAETQVLTGRLLQYRYVPDGTAPLDTGADLDIVGSTTGYVYVNQDNIGTSAFSKAPRQATHDETGAASLYASGGEPVEGYLYMAGEPLTITIAAGGNTKAGKLYLWVG